MSEHLRALGRGFNWLAAAAAVSRGVDLLSNLAMLLLLTRSQLGDAAIVLSIGMVVEAFNGLGTGDAIVQAPAVTTRQLDTVFAVSLGAALAIGGALAAAAPLLGAPDLLLIAAKQPIVAAAVVPLALMNRELRFKRIAVIGTVATLLAAATRLGLGALGAGSTALVAGYASSGLFTLAGALAASRFRPRPHLDLPATRPLFRFGVRSLLAGFAEQSFKNIDFLLVGAFYGPAPLADYKVAFDIAMEPAMAVGTVTNRAALPVLARVAGDGGQVRETFAAALRRVMRITVPLLLVLVLAAIPLTRLLHDRAGHSYAAAGVPLMILAVAAAPRLLVQLLAVLMVATGRPAMAARLSLLTLVLLAGGVTAAALAFPAPAQGLTAVALVWLLIYPPLLLVAQRAAPRPQ